MSKVAIVTDSTAYIPQDLVEEYNISIAPQILIWAEETFEDGVDIQPDEFYEKLKTAKVMPTSSQVTVTSIHNIFTKLSEEGYDILAVLLSNQLSGTIDSATQARESFPDTNIEIVDSETVAMALGFQVLAAARVAAEGADLSECKALAEKAKNHTGVVFAVETLEFLHRGGRIGGGSRYLGAALNIKPILEVTGGRVESVERVRTRKKSLQRILDMVGERVAGKELVRLAALHANVPGEAKELLEQANSRINTVESIFSTISPVVGTHTGPGTIGLAYMVGI
ncbi:MAG: DegV family protein [Anaerolineales bacterium]|nr:DegV family protein [Anaerolineales bacterium]